MKMSTREATRQVRLKQWAGIIKEKASSGLHVVEYCQLRGITKHQYFYWLRKVKEEALRQTTQIVEISAPDDHEDTSVPELSVAETLRSPDVTDPVLTISKGDMRISAGSNITPGLLKIIMEGIRHA